LNRRLIAAIGSVGLACLGPGCGSTPIPEPAPGKNVQAGANTRIKFKEEYKKMIGKDGKLLFKPSESNKRPPDMPQREP
jgi:hypothetical protein